MGPIYQRSSREFTIPIMQYLIAKNTENRYVMPLSASRDSAPRAFTLLKREFQLPYSMGMLSKSLAGTGKWEVLTFICTNHYCRPI